MEALLIGNGHPPSAGAYPTLDPARKAAVAHHWLQLVVALQPFALTEIQVAELKAVIDAQLAATEVLHTFPLTNSDEPAFVMPARSGSA